MTNTAAGGHSNTDSNITPLFDESEICVQIQQNIKNVKKSTRQLSILRDKYHAKTMSLPHTILPLKNNSIEVIHTDITPDTQTSAYNPATDTMFWKTIGGNPVKSLRDYNETFNQNTPMPFLKDNTIMYTYESKYAYNQIIHIIIKMYLKNGFQDIHINSYRFLDLLVNHLPLFERHWRKMVVDIREGTSATATTAVTFNKK
jgi:hypothetical protein